MPISLQHLLNTCRHLCCAVCPTKKMTSANKIEPDISVSTTIVEAPTSSFKADDAQDLMHCAPPQLNFAQKGVSPDAGLNEEHQDLHRCHIRE